MTTCAGGSERDFGVQFVRYLAHADELSESSQSAVYALHPEAAPAAVWESEVEFSQECTALGTVFLGAASNSLLALRLLTLPDGFAEEGRTEARITLNGTAGHLRQTIECAAVAHWLLGANSGAERQVRGFAALRRDAIESPAYARAARAINVSSLEGMLDALISDGQRLGLLVQASPPPHWQPRQRLSDVTGLSRTHSAR